MIVLCFLANRLFLLWTTLLLLLLFVDVVVVVYASPLDGGPWGPPHDPIADPRAIVVVGDGDVRITVLTSRLVRIQQKKTTASSFEDCKTLAFLNRKLPVPPYTTTTTPNGVFKLQTEYLTVTLDVSSTRSMQNNNNNSSSSTMPTAGGGLDTLSISGILNQHDKWTWQYGTGVDPYNLLGTIRTLDDLNVVSLNCSRHDDDAHCEYGLISKAGYAIVNDTSNWCIDSDDDWWQRPNQDVQDLYVFGHGHDYKAALFDYMHVGGNIPLLPRYAYGIWFSRWYNYNPADIMDVVFAYEQRSLPLDVFVLDMNWHTKHDWTGYSWDVRLFPYPHDTLGYLKSRSDALAVTLNLHDANGVGPWESKYKTLCHVLGYNATMDDKPIPFTIVNRTVMLAIDDVILHELQQQGVDFWWIDWQQGESGVGGAVGGKMNPTIWTAHVRSTQSSRLGEDRRSMVLARWGGLGAHRYPVHFSGDVATVSWQTLAFQPYFSMTAVNVGAIWSHDTEGPSNDPELYTRFVQWSAFSGITRAHERGESAGRCVRSDNDQVCSVVEPWQVPTKFAEANYEALRTRASLLPYIYTSAHRAHQTGLQFTLPMYYEWSELENAYDTAALKPDKSSNLGSQYLFGNDIWVAPVAVPASPKDGLARTTLWIPPGIWVGIPSGQVVQGDDNGSTLFRTVVDLKEIPVFARAGAVIPTRPIRTGASVGLAMAPFDEIIWIVCLCRGAPTSGSGTLYEDDGRTLAYTRDVHATTRAQFTVRNDSILLTTSPSGQFYDSVPYYRATTFRLMNTLPPLGVSYDNGTEIPWSRFGSKGTWTFDSKDMSVHIKLPDSAVLHGERIVVRTKMSGKIAETVDGMGFKIARAREAKSALDEARLTPGSQTGDSSLLGALLRVSSTGSSLEYLAGHSREDFDRTVVGFRELLLSAVAEVENMTYASEIPRLPRELSSGPKKLLSASTDPEIRYRISRALTLLDSGS